MPDGTSTAKRLRPSPSIIISTLALVVATSSGAYAAVTIAEKNSVVSKSIKNGQVKTKDVADNAINSNKIKDGQVTSADIGDGQLGTADIADLAIGTTDFADSSVTSAKLAANAVTAAKIVDGAVTTGKLSDTSVTTGKLADDSVTSAKVPDFGLSNQDVGVLYAVVASNGTLSRSSGGVTSSRNFLGEYTVNFGRNLTQCAFVASISTTGFSGTSGPGQIETAGSGISDNGVYVRVTNSAGTVIDAAFHLIVVC